MKTSSKPLPTTTILFLVVVLLIGLLLLNAANPAAALPDRLCLVKWDAKGINDGSSWPNAYNGLLAVQTALENDSCAQIWVARGVYLTGTQRTDTFQLKDGVVLYGGFAGKESSLSDRDALANETTLSGNIGDVTIHTDNSYHVVTGSGTDRTAVLDGFTIANGHASGLGANDNRGAGIYIDSGSPTLRNLTIRDNFASSSGGGLYNNNNSQSEYYNITFKDNQATYGGAMYNGMSSLTLLNATFTGNMANAGAAIYNAYSNPSLTNITLTGNTASNYGGGLANEWSDPILANVILWDNAATNADPEIHDGEGSESEVSYSVVQGGFPSGSNILTADPRLAALGDHGGHTQVFPLKFDSPAIDAGDDASCSLADQRLLSRSGQGTACDIGAYEFQPVLYVSPTGRDSNRCFTWSFACDLQYALSLAEKGQEIWAKAGTYKPTTGSDRTATFQLRGAVDLYGGFAGTETTLEQRNWVTSKSILSGDLGLQDDNSDNSYHVVYMKGWYIGDGWETILDGFTISHGNAKMGTDSTRGGGLLLDGANPIVRNVIFSENAASYGGGMAAVNNSFAILQNVTVTDNQAIYGGGLSLEEGNLELSQVAVISNFASGDGGGMYVNGGNIELSVVGFSNNQADGSGGGMVSASTTGSSLTTVDFTGNSAGQSGGGLLIPPNSSLALSDVTFNQNEALSGGGVYALIANPQLTNVRFLDNLATESGGGMSISGGDGTLTAVEFSGNRAGAGGGIYLSGSSPEITMATFTGNETFLKFGNPLATNGGGLLANSASDPILKNVSFSGNFAESNGGGLAAIDDSSPFLQSVTLSANQADYGGGMFADSGNPLLINVTFNGNSAYSGGGIYVRSTDYLKIDQATFAANEATGDAIESGRGGGIYLNSSEKPYIRNAILWGNSALTGGEQLYNAPDYSGWGNQLLESSVIEGGCPAEVSCTKIITDDPLLGPLGDHGGTTLTMPIGEGSSALDAASGTYTTCPDSDQRGISRPQNTYCDIGAFEARLYTLIVNPSGSGSGTVSGLGIDCGATCQHAYVENTEVTLTAEPDANSLFAGWSGACSGSGSCTLAMSKAQNVIAQFELIPPGSHALTVSLSGDGQGSVSGDGIDCHDGPGADCSEVYSEGTQVTLTASPAPNFIFEGWTGDCSNGNGACELIMSEAKTVSATFGSGGSSLFLPAIIK